MFSWTWHSMPMTASNVAAKASEGDASFACFAAFSLASERMGLNENGCIVRALCPVRARVHMASDRSTEAVVCGIFGGFEWAR